MVRISDNRAEAFDQEGPVMRIPRVSATAKDCMEPKPRRMSKRPLERGRLAEADGNRTRQAAFTASTVLKTVEPTRRSVASGTEGSGFPR